MGEEARGWLGEGSSWDTSDGWNWLDIELGLAGNDAQLVEGVDIFRNFQRG